MMTKDIVNFRQIFSEDTIDNFFNYTIKKGVYCREVTEKEFNKSFELFQNIFFFFNFKKPFEVINISK